MVDLVETLVMLAMQSAAVVVDLVEMVVTVVEALFVVVEEIESLKAMSELEAAVERAVRVYTVGGLAGVAVLVDVAFSLVTMASAATVVKVEGGVGEEELEAVVVVDRKSVV